MQLSTIWGTLVHFETALLLTFSGERERPELGSHFLHGGLEVLEGLLDDGLILGLRLEPELEGGDVVEGLALAVLHREAEEEVLVAVGHDLEAGKTSCEMLVREKAYNSLKGLSTMPKIHQRKFSHDFLFFWSPRLGFLT